MFKEFKEFAMQGNLVDMATGLVIGAAFGTVIQSLVNDIIMPIVGYFLGGVDFSNIFTLLGDGEYATIAAAKEAGAATINWGLFINAIISFIIVAWVIFILIKAMNKAKREKEAEPEAPPRNEVLLEEIRDALKR